jgi:hypothetical protein
MSDFEQKWEVSIQPFQACELRKHYTRFALFQLTGSLRALKFHVQYCCVISS